MISQLQNALSAIMPNKVAASTSSEKPSDPAVVDKTTKTPADKATFSTLASQLSESTARAAARDAVMTHAELGKYGLNRINEFLVESPKANNYTRAMEVPDTRDPELLDRARRASEFVTLTLAGHSNAKSPFEKLSREQLNVIAYDDSGAFTLNERRAAYQGVQKIDDAWRKTAIPAGILEQARTGNATKFYNEALSYYKSLPAIEKAVDYPKDTETLLKARIKSDPALPSFPGVVTRQGGDRKLTLYDILAGIVDTQKSKADPGSPLLRKKFTPRTSATPVSWNERWAKQEASAAKAVKPVQAASLSTSLPGGSSATASMGKGEAVSSSTPTAE
ncbi:hypothetical protein [Pseudomonas abietaniphila]|uniref:Uncharacterized protein n=1 Tax=Pseudomonas abietaniphila TaxID=89065 RepID=A0A1G7X0L3_9PSED|nr:hypothetical protein [Pseudomonas abietaniphila]SDG77724.1 hypothetical protein SAMN05216605_103126 [Pseudomonas abietaniphila]